jgi:hypothetical protein
VIAKVLIAYFACKRIVCAFALRISSFLCRRCASSIDGPDPQLLKVCPSSITRRLEISASLQQQEFIDNAMAKLGKRFLQDGDLGDLPNMRDCMPSKDHSPNECEEDERSLSQGSEREVEERVLRKRSREVPPKYKDVDSDEDGFHRDQDDFGAMLQGANLHQSGIRRFLHNSPVDPTRVKFSSSAKRSEKKEVHKELSPFLEGNRSSNALIFILN